MLEPKIIPLANASFSKSIARETPRIGIDTEFNREKTFFAEFCLLQVSTEDKIFCLDPFSSSNFENKQQKEILKQMSKIQWVLHSGRQDLEVIFQNYNLLPKYLFDTQIAAGFIGLSSQIGYANLIKELFNVELEKAYTRADWSQRPLPKALIKYAADDVRYLLPAYEFLSKRLESLGRLEWVVEDSSLLLNTNHYTNLPNNAVHRIKGTNKLSGKHWSTAYNLAKWREKEAIATNTPRQWVLSNQAILKISTFLPKSLDNLSKIDKLSTPIFRKYGAHFIKIIQNSKSPESNNQKEIKFDEREKKILKRMTLEVKIFSKELNIAAELIATKKDLINLIKNKKKSSLLIGWRKKQIGNRLLELL